MSESVYTTIIFILLGGIFLIDNDPIRIFLFFIQIVVLILQIKSKRIGDKLK